MPTGDIARSKVVEALDDMKHDGEMDWSTDYRCTLSDGSSLQIQVDPRDHFIRAVVFDAQGTQIDATEGAADPPVRVIFPIHQLRALVDQQLVTRLRS